MAKTMDPQLLVRVEEVKVTLQGMRMRMAGKAARPCKQVEMRMIWILRV
jgi:hypothetical protein